MAERVKVVARGDGRPVLMDVRLARHLVDRGSHEYVTEPVAAVSKKAAKAEEATPKKRAYKRKDLRAEDD